MTLAEKKHSLVAELSAIRDPQHRFAHVIARGCTRPPLSPDYKSDEFKVEGCLARLWFVPVFVNGKCHFQSDSDSAIVRGVAGLICEFYSGSTPSEILAANTSFLQEVGINQHLTQNRKNGLGRLEERIKEFTRSHLPPETTGIS